MHWEHNKVVGIGSSSAGGACTDEPANLEKSLGEQLRVRGFDPVLWAVPSFLVPASLLARACAILAALFLFLFTSGFDFCGEDFSEGSLRARFDPFGFLRCAEVSVPYVSVRVSMSANSSLPSGKKGTRSRP